jgi:hypothetical protein
MKGIKKMLKIIDYSYRKSLFQVRYAHPSRFDEFVSYKEELGLDHLEDLELKKEFQKLIFLSILRTYEKLGDVSREESEIFFENFEKKYQKT